MRWITLHILVLLLSFTVVPIHAGIENDKEEFIAFFKRNGDELKEDWQLPSGNDLSYWGTNTDNIFYKSIINGRAKHPYWAKADFNSDGIADRVFLLFNKYDDRGCFFALMSNSKNFFSLVRIMEADKHHAVEVDLEGPNNSPRLIVVIFESDIGTIFTWNSVRQEFDAQ